MNEVLVTWWEYGKERVKSFTDPEKAREFLRSLHPDCEPELITEEQS